MLTPKQERFVQNMVKGMSQRRSYLDAFPSSKKWKPETVDNKASKLFNSDEILARYNEIIKKSEDEAIMSAIERKKWLTKVIYGEIKDKQVFFNDGEADTVDIEANVTTKMKAINILNKMTGDYIQDIRLSGDKDNPIITQMSTIDSVAKQIKEVVEEIDVEVDS
jgi:phage terminase small subunit